jgi:solute carrier family 35 (UDP-sugar transporter), member A1/2/3
VTGFFLKILDSVLKSVASAIEVLLTTLLSTLFFGTPLALADVVAAAMVGGGVALYARPAGQPAGRGMVSAEGGGSELTELLPATALKK